jgi:RND family efflux transporter MFP subunit
MRAGFRPYLVLVPPFIAACLAFGCKEPPPEEAKPAPVRAEPVKMVPLAEKVDFLGVTQPLPDKVARLTARVDGQVKAILVGEPGKPLSEGQEVEANQVIVQLDDRLVRANLDKAQATLTDLDQQDKQAELAATVAGIRLNGLEKLRPSHVLDPLAPALVMTPGSWILTPVSLVMDTRQPVNVSRVDLDMARLALETTLSQRKATKARLAGGAADVQALTLQLAMHTIRAPIAGRLGMILVSPGQSVNIGTPIADVVQLEDYFDVLCYVSPRMVHQLKRDQAGRVTLPGDPDSDVDGVVVFVAQTAQADTGNFAVKVRFRNLDLKFRVNIVLRVEVEIDESKERRTIPESALMEDQDPPGVVVVEEVEMKKNADGKEERFGKAKKYTVELGVRDHEKQVVEIKKLMDKGTEVEIKDQRFVTEGGNLLEDNDVVKLDESEKKEKKEKD